MHVECAPSAPEGAPAEGGVYRNRIWGTWPPNPSARFPATLFRSATDRRQEPPEVALGLAHRVAAELLQEGIGQRQRHHRLADHARGGHDADVAALVVGLDPLLTGDVDRAHRRLHGR